MPAVPRVPFVTTIAVALVLVGCGPEPEPAFPATPYFFPAAVQEQPRVDAVSCGITVGGRRLSVEDAMRTYHVAGVTAAALWQGQVVWAKGWGFADARRQVPMTPETIMQAASLSKPVSSVGIMRMVQAKKLDLDRDVAEYLDGWEATYRGQPVAITLRQLLSHSAGLNVHGFGGYRSNVEDLPSTLGVLNGEGNTARVVVEFPPGTDTKYSGGGFTVAQAVVEEEVQAPFDRAMYDWVIRPFGLKRSTFEQPLAEDHAKSAASAHDDAGNPIRGRWHVYPEKAAAGLWTTPTDLLTLASSLAASYNGAAGPLSQPMVRQMLTPTSANGKMGISWAVKQDGAVIEASHGGQNAGFTATIIWRTDGSGAAVMVNGDGPIASAVARAIGEQYGWRESSGAGCAR